MATRQCSSANGYTLAASYSVPMGPKNVQKKSDVRGSREAGSFGESVAQLRRKIDRLEREVALVRRFAWHDPLTGLPNRSLMLDRLKQAKAQATRQHKKVGVLLIDLDDFKKVNDEFGHRAGDTILKGVAARLLSCLRMCDTACRYGGDEFVILLPEIDSADQLDRVKRKIHQNLCRPHQLGKRSVVVGGSIGGALFREDAESSAKLIGIADAAMYRAKHASNEAGPVPIAVQRSSRSLRYPGDQIAFAAEHTSWRNPVSLCSWTQLGSGAHSGSRGRCSSRRMAPRGSTPMPRGARNREFSHARARATRLSSEPELAPNQSEWSDNRIRAYAQSPAAQTELIPQALLHIRRVELTVPVYADTSDSTLNRGAGLIAGTASPGAAGNTGIAAHRDGFFRALKDVALGDRIEIEHFSGTRRRIACPPCTS